MEAFREMGEGCPMIGVDSENPSGAHHPYESLGFIPGRRNIAYVKVF